MAIWSEIVADPKDCWLLVFESFELANDSIDDEESGSSFRGRLKVRQLNLAAFFKTGLAEGLGSYSSGGKFD